MLIKKDACKGCGLCIPYCPMNAISVADRKVCIDRDECVECGVCRRVNICGRDVFQKEELAWPRSIRAVFSDPLNIHKETNMAGRGTSEMKTNDVTGRFKRGDLGLALEAGRPGVGARFTELEKLTRKLVALGASLEPLNPFTKFVDPETGDIDAEILHEKVMSAVVECAIGHLSLEEIVTAIREVEKDLDTVVSVALAVRAENGSFGATFKKLDDAQVFYRNNGKLNVGLGRPLYQETGRK